MRKMAEAFLASPRGDELDQDLTPGQRRLARLCEPHDLGIPVYVLYPGQGAVLPACGVRRCGTVSRASALIKPEGRPLRT